MMNPIFCQLPSTCIPTESERDRIVKGLNWAYPGRHFVTYHSSTGVTFQIEGSGWHLEELIERRCFVKGFLCAIGY